MNIVYQKGTLKSSRTDALVLFAAEGPAALNASLAPLRKVFGNRLARILGLEDFTGKTGTSCSFLSEGKFPAARIFLAGVGKPDQLTAEKIRRAASLAATGAQAKKVGSVTFLLPGELPGRTDRLTPAQVAKAIAEGVTLGTYRYDKYITEHPENKRSLTSVRIIGETDREMSATRKAIRETGMICDAVKLARDLGNAPPNEIYPETLADAARRSGAKYGYRVIVWDEKRIRQTGFGGLLAVSAGSARPPRFVIMEMNGGVTGLETIVLVGKGVTFDAGGISIKPASGMAEMKMDMSGAAAVIGTMEAACRLKIPVHLVGLVPATENLLGGAAMRPGDIITHYGGKTSEVDNTDAEGRLILADALAYAPTFKPAAVIDLATLTGACVVALGHHATGMMGNDEVLMAELKAAGEKTYERVWPLPLFEEFEKLIKSDVADVKNVGGRWAGAITAGLFLKKFIGEHPWVHLDIAGTAILEEPLPYAPKGGSGVGVRLLVEFLKARTAG
ncbi:MAG TPA: leucyl aminopeptidase [Bacteroidota bacterium]|nr:leucyl aminopeptidase [Bacteroidota bacterium]